MSERRHIVIAFLAGMSVPLLALYAATRAAPLGEVYAEEESAVLETVLEEPIAAHQAMGSEKIYVRSRGGVDLIKNLRAKYTRIQIAPWSERPEDLGCKASDPSLVVMAPCERDDYVAAEVLSFPLWRTAIASVGTFNTGGQLILVHVGGRWRVIVDRRFII